MKQIPCMLLLLLSAPTHAIAEECFEEVKISAQFEQREITFIYEAHERLKVIPATYKTVPETVVIKPDHCPGEELKSERVSICRVDPTICALPSQSLQLIPATFERRQIDQSTVQMILKTPWSSRMVPFGGNYSKVLVWRRSVGASCPAEDVVPEQTRVVMRRRVDTPTHIEAFWVPKQAKVLTERVAITPARTEKRPANCAD